METYINSPEIDLYTTYFHKERQYLMSKYNDIYLWQLYCYFLENKNLPTFYKSNKQIIKDLYACISEHKLIECKKILLSENILIEEETGKGKAKNYKFVRMPFSIDHCINDSTPTAKTTVVPLQKRQSKKIS